MFLGAMNGEYPWLWRGLPETPPHFEEALWRDVLVQYAIEDKRTGQQIGLVGAYNANNFHRFAYVTLTLLDDYQRRVWPFEAIVLFGNILFTRYSLENVYAETTGELYEEFQSGAGRLFTEVGRFPGRLSLNDRREDLIVTGMSRAQWLDQGVPLLERCTRQPERGPSPVT